MSEVHNKASRDDPDFELEQGEPQITPLPGSRQTTTKSKWSHTRWFLTAGTLLLILAVIVAGLLSVRHQAQPASSKPASMATATPIQGLAGGGHSVTMTIVDGVAYVGTMDRVVYALRTSDGTLLWRYRTENAIIQTSVVVNGVVYVSAAWDIGPYGFYALRASDGQLLWHYQTSDFIDAPAVDHGVVYLPSSGGMVALRADDGFLLWRNAAAPAGFDPPLVVNGVIYVSYIQEQNNNGTGAVYALRASDGHLLWSLKTSSFSAPPSMAQVMAQGVLYVASPGVMLALRPSDGHVLWHQMINDIIPSQPVVLNGVIYLITLKFDLPSASMQTGGPVLMTAVDYSPHVGGAIPFNEFAPLKGGVPTAYALRASDGTVLWRYTRNKDNYASLLSLENGVLYVASSPASQGSRSMIYALQASNGALLWQHATQQLPSAAIVANGVIYVGSQDATVYALRTRDGSRIWNHPIDGSVYTAPIPVGSVVYVGADNGIVYALDADKGTLRWYYQTAVKG